MQRLIVASIVLCAGAAIPVESAVGAAFLSDPFSGYSTGSLDGQTVQGAGLSGSWSGSAWNVLSAGLTPGSGGALNTADTGATAANTTVSVASAVTTATTGSSFYFGFDLYRDIGTMPPGWFPGDPGWASVSSAALKLTANNGNGMFDPGYLQAGINYDGTYFINSRTLGYSTLQTSGGLYTNGTTVEIVGKYTSVAGANNDILALYAVTPGTTTEPTSALLSLTFTAGDIFGSSGGIATAAFTTNNGAVNGHSATIDEFRMGTSWGDVIVQTATYLPGDADKNGTVNGADLNIVLSNYNRTFTGDAWAYGDFDTNDTVNGADLNIVLSNYNRVSSATAAVPEPASALLVAAAIACLSLCRGWRKRRQ